MQDKTMTAYEWEMLRHSLRTVEGFKSILVRDRIKQATRMRNADECVTVRLTDSQSEWLESQIGVA
jgi:hypothetical protein